MDQEDLQTDYVDEDGRILMLRQAEDGSLYYEPRGFARLTTWVSHVYVNTLVLAL